MTICKIPIKREERHILHIDADAFFASVEQVLNPTLRGKAILVGGPTKDKGIVSAASYEAKKFGIHSGMALYMARRLCPQAIVINGHFDKYREFSQRMYEVFCDYTPDVEMASIDEAYLDITGCDLLNGVSAEGVARAILMQVNKKLGISVSGGLASNRVVAKTASGLHKPHKLTVVPFGKEKAFLADLNLNVISGIGRRTFAMLEKFGFVKCRDLSERDINELVDQFGLAILPIWKMACGIGSSRVIATRPLPKSISKERTFYQPVGEEKICIEAIGILGRRVFEKLRSYDLKAKTIFLKIKYYGEGRRSDGKRKFEYFSAQRHLDFASSNDRELQMALKKFFLENYDRSKEVRLIGVGVSGLVKNYNLSLFEDGRKSDRLFAAIDSLRTFHGEEAVQYGAFGL